MINQELLNFDQNAKTIKGQKRNYMTGILYLAPSNESGINVCPFASKGCAASCLYTAGMGVFQKVKDARIKKTLSLFKDRENFMLTLENEIRLAIIRANFQKKRLTIRLNGTSDLSVENWGLMEKFPNIQFYDYTKNPVRMERYLNGQMPKNYHLTFSLSETNKSMALHVLARGGNVAMVFGTKNPKEFPKTYFGYKVVNGDRDDLRFKDGKNVIVALKMKGKAIYDETGFVQNVVEQKDIRIAA